ncbi:MAG TPA: NAD-binding protein [Sandaracinaceae bacterium LLY-WYZ-13_1]|nr:NAD-binding protein [Sandaracinaceae bacterium LLY-WYZ-13_1]
MRAILVGASTTAVMTAERLLARGHEVVIVESDRAAIDAVYDDLDCSFLHGDGSKPSILREARPESADILFALTDDDRVNILASLVARNLGYPRVVTAIADRQYESMCAELGLDPVIVPDRTISRYLIDLAEGVGVAELTTFIRGEARFFSFVVDELAGKRVRDLELPAEARAICRYREDVFELLDSDDKLRARDEVVVLTHSRHLPELEERWRPVSVESPK